MQHTNKLQVRFLLPESICCSHSIVYASLEAQLVFHQSCLPTKCCNALGGLYLNPCLRYCSFNLTRLISNYNTRSITSMSRLFGFVPSEMSWGSEPPSALSFLGSPGSAAGPPGASWSCSAAGGTGEAGSTAAAAAGLEGTQTLTVKPTQSFTRLTTSSSEGVVSEGS